MDFYFEKSPVKMQVFLEELMFISFTCPYRKLLSVMPTEGRMLLGREGLEWGGHHTEREKH